MTDIDRSSKEWQRYAAAVLAASDTHAVTASFEVMADYAVSAADALYIARREADEADEKIRDDKHKAARLDLERRFPVGAIVREKVDGDLWRVQQIVEVFDQQVRVECLSMPNHVGLTYSHDFREDEIELVEKSA